MRRITDIYKVFCKFVGIVLSLIFNRYVIRIYKDIRNQIFFYAYKGRFSKIGKNCFLEYPFVLSGQEKISIGNNFSSRSRLQLQAITEHNGNLYNPSIIIGDNVSINYDVHIGCINKIEIGNGVLIASKVFITDHFHGGTEKDDLLVSPSDRKVVSKGPIKIGNNVWIGEGVAIMPNVTIGDNCIIGANAVVTHSFPPNCVIGGNPAKIIKKL